MSVEQIKLIIRNGRAAIAHVGGRGPGTPHGSFEISKARDKAIEIVRRQRKQNKGLVYAEVNHDVIEQSREVKTKMFGGTDDGGVNDIG